MMITPLLFDHLCHALMVYEATVPITDLTCNALKAHTTEFKSF